MIVVFPVSPVDQELAVKLSAWIAELGPNEGHDLLLVRDIRCHENNIRSIKHDLGKVFDNIDETVVVERLDSWPLAPNLFYRYAAKHVQFVSKQPFLWLEADCVPLRSGFVAAIAKEYDAEPRKPFLGDFVQVKDVVPHCSGIAVYPANVVDYAPSALHAREYAWDVWAADEIVPKMKQTALIAHRWKHPRFNNQGEVDNLLGQIGDAILFHQDKSGTLIDFLRDRRSSPRLAQTNAVAVNVEAGKGATDIFIKTYPKDYEWLKYCFLSIHKFVSGVRNVVVVSSDRIAGLMDLDEGWPTVKVVPEYGNDGYLSQQVFKLYADTYTDAEWILFTDSDTIFTRPVTPDTYLKDGKCVWMMTPMAEAHPNQQNSWAGVMKKFMGKEPEFEWMRRHPSFIPRWLLQELRTFCKERHGVELKDYVMAQPYREFSEFNVMGFYAYEYHRDKFEWFDTSKHSESEWPVLTVDQCWSHNPIPTEKWEKILGEGELSRYCPMCKKDHLPGEHETLGGAVHSSEPERSTIPTAAPTQSDTPKLVSSVPVTVDLVEALKLHFVSPLAKARILKKLKAAPILK